jgi:hypothetical protein
MSRPYSVCNRKGSKPATNENLPLDVRAMHRRGYLAPGAYCSWGWWRGDNKEGGASIGCRSDGQSVRLLYSHAGEEVDLRVVLDWTPCNYGGARPWWRCPSCGRRVAVIYGAGKVFACRHCYGLCYGCQKEKPSNRALRRAFKIRERLGDDGGLTTAFPEKPKGMHWETYSRLALKGHAAEWESLGLAARFCGRETQPAATGPASKVE